LIIMDEGGSFRGMKLLKSDKIQKNKSEGEYVRNKKVDIKR